MDSPIPGMLAIFANQKLERIALSYHHSKFGRDKTLVLNNLGRPVAFKDPLNGVFEDIQFTMEERNSHKLPYLDVLTWMSAGGGINDYVYRQLTTINRILLIDSNHPASTKSATPKPCLS